MSPNIKELEKLVSQLDANDKAHLALFILESLEAPDEGDIDEAWRIEAEARLAAVQRGEALTLPADEVFANLSLRFP